MKRTMTPAQEAAWEAAMGREPVSMRSPQRTIQLTRLGWKAWAWLRVSK